MKRLFDAETTNATSEAFEVGQGHRTAWCWGTFGGATVKLQVSPDRQKWFDETDLTFTAEGKSNLYVSPGTWVRGVITGGSGASINLHLT